MLAKTIEYLQKRGIRVVLYTPLYHEAYTTDPDLITTPDLFFNSDHVNECGGRAFSERLWKAMQATD